MQTETQIREGLRDCKSAIKELNERLTTALLCNDNGDIAECASHLGMLGNIYLAITEIVK